MIQNENSMRETIFHFKKIIILSANFGDDKNSQYNAVSDAFLELNFDDLNSKVENYE